jgi:hypothetical protein
MKWILSAAMTVSMCLIPAAQAQSASHQPSPDAHNTNMSAYIELLRSDVRTVKATVMGQMMDLNDDQAAKFWPIYREYDLKLQELNDKKLASIKQYANDSETITNEQAETLAKSALELENQRNELKKVYFEKVSAQLGGILAARFLQVENQLLMLIDLQIASSLPIVGS